MIANNPTLVGTAGGTFLSIVPNIQSEDITRTIILASVGAIVSFTISLLLKSLNKKRKKVSLALVVVTCGLNKIKAKSRDLAFLYSIWDIRWRNFNL